MALINRNNQNTITIDMMTQFQNVILILEKKFKFQKHCSRKGVENSPFNA